MKLAWGPFLRALALSTAVLPAHASGWEEAGLDPIYTRVILSDSIVATALDSKVAQICFVREQFARSLSLPDETVYLDGIPAGMLPQRTWFAVPMLPGAHVIGGVFGCPKLVLVCLPGQSYLVRLREKVDDKDRVAVDWILDDPTSLPAIARSSQLRLASTTPSGFEYLSSKARHLTRAESAPPLPQLSTEGTETFDHILSERPLDQVNLERDFSQLYGHLAVGPRGIEYRLKCRVPTSLMSWRVVVDSFDVAPNRIVKVRYGGTRFTGATPWVEVIYRNSADELRYADFAVTEEADGVQVYNRMFAVIQRLLAAREQPDSLESPRTAGP